jgi:cell shape-determining protein MreD
VTTSLILHSRLAGSAAFFTFAMGVWGVIRFLRGQPLNSSYLGALAIGEGLIVIEALIGAFRLLNTGIQPERWVHFLYGTLAALVWPFLFTYIRQTDAQEGAEELDPRVESLLFAAGSFFLWGLVMRAISTAHL